MKTGCSHCFLRESYQTKTTSSDAKHLVPEVRQLPIAASMKWELELTKLFRLGHRNNTTKMGERRPITCMLSFATAFCSWNSWKCVCMKNLPISPGIIMTSKIKSLGGPQSQMSIWLQIVRQKKESVNVPNTNIPMNFILETSTIKQN